MSTATHLLPRISLAVRSWPNTIGCRGVASCLVVVLSHDHITRGWGGQVLVCLEKLAIVQA